MEWVGYLLLLLLPFERLPSWEVANLTVRASSLILLGFLTFGLPYLIAKKRLLPLTILDRSVLLLPALFLLSSFWAVDAMRAFLIGALLTFTVSGYFLLSRTLGVGSFDEQKISRFLFGSTFVVCVFGLFQFLANGFGADPETVGLLPRYGREILGFPRIQSTAVEPLFLANFMLLPIFLLFVGLLERPKLTGLALLALFFVTFILTLSRGGYLAFLAGCIVLFALGCFRPQISLVKVLGVLAASAIIAAGLIMAVSGSLGARTAFNHALVADSPISESSASRLERTTEAWGLFKERPLAGWGAGSYGLLSSLPNAPDVGGYPTVNNQYLELLAELGLIGLALFGFLVWRAALKLQMIIFAPETKNIGLALSAVLAAVLVQYLFFSTLYLLFFWVVIGLIAAVPARAKTG